MSDLRSKMIRLAASMPKGSSERKALLDVLADTRTAGGFVARGINKHISDVESYSQAGEPRKALYALGQALFVLSGAPPLIGGLDDRRSLDAIGNELASLGSKLVKMGER